MDKMAEKKRLMISITISLHIHKDHKLSSLKSLSIQNLHQYRVLLLLLPSKWLPYKIICGTIKNVQTSEFTRVKLSTYTTDERVNLMIFFLVFFYIHTTLATKFGTPSISLYSPF